MDVRKPEYKNSKKEKTVWCVRVGRTMRGGNGQMARENEGPMIKGREEGEREEETRHGRFDACRSDAS